MTHTQSLTHSSHSLFLSLPLSLPSPRLNPHSSLLFSSHPIPSHPQFKHSSKTLTNTTKSPTPQTRNTTITYSHSLSFFYPSVPLKSNPIQSNPKNRDKITQHKTNKQTINEQMLRISRTFEYFLFFIYKILELLELLERNGLLCRTIDKHDIHSLYTVIS